MVPQRRTKTYESRPEWKPYPAVEIMRIHFSHHSQAMLSQCITQVDPAGIQADMYAKEAHMPPTLVVVIATIKQHDKTDLHCFYLFCMYCWRLNARSGG